LAAQADLEEIDWMRIGTAGERWNAVCERFLALTRAALELRESERAGNINEDASSDARRAARHKTFHKRRMAAEQSEGDECKAYSLRSQFPPAWEHGWSARVCDAADSFDAKHEQSAREAKQLLRTIGGRTRSELHPDDRKRIDSSLSGLRW